MNTENYSIKNIKTFWRFMSHHRLHKLFVEFHNEYFLSSDPHIYLLMLLYVCGLAIIVGEIIHSVMNLFHFSLSLKINTYKNIFYPINVITLLIISHPSLYI